MDKPVGGQAGWWTRGKKNPQVYKPPQWKITNFFPFLSHTMSLKSGNCHPLAWPMADSPWRVDRTLKSELGGNKTSVSGRSSPTTQLGRRDENVNSVTNTKPLVVVLLQKMSCCPNTFAQCQQDNLFEILAHNKRKHCNRHIWMSICVLQGNHEYVLAIKVRR